VIVGIIRRKPVLIHASVVCEGMASVNSVNSVNYCGQTAGWMKTPLGTEGDIGAGHIVLDGFPALRERDTAPLASFRPMSVVATVAHLSYC